MKTNNNGRAARVRANQRLHNLTVGTAILGFAATGAFGALAAFTYNGTTQTTSNTAFTTTGTTASTTQAAPAVTTTTRKGHVSSGGS